MVNLSSYVGDSHAEPPKENAVERGINLLDVAAKAAVYSAVQQPMDGICQLAGGQAPKFMDKPKEYDFNSPEWYASTIGHGAGFMAPYMLTSKLTGLTGMKTGVGKAMLDGAITGFTMTPTQEGENAFVSRGLAAFNSTVMFGTQHYFTGKLTGAFAAAAETSPILTRLGINTASGVGAGLTALEATSLISGKGLVTDHQVLLENAVAAGATGFALDAFNIATTRGRTTTHSENAKPGSEQPTPQTVQTHETVTRAAEIGDKPTTSDAAAPSTGRNLPIEKYREIEQWTNPSDGTVGARQYRSEYGTVFWQIPDGRIHFEEPSTNGPIFKTWSPFGSHEPATFLGPEGELGRKVFTRHEPQGFFFDSDGNPEKQELYNLYKDTNVAERPPLSKDLAHELALSVPLEVEPDHFASSRLVRTADGADYETTQLKMRVPGEAVPPKGVTMTDFLNNWTREIDVPARRYSVLNGENAIQYADVIRQHSEGTMDATTFNNEVARLKATATSVLVPEHYAANLDEVRDLRQTAVLKPSENPHMSEDILRARRELFLSGYADRLLPEHWGQFLDVVPNSKTIKQLQLIDARDPDGTGTIADTAIEEGRIRFYAENNGIQQHVRRTLLHEWAHTTEGTRPSLRAAYDAARKIEAFEGRDYANTNEHEDWAVHMAEMVMDPNPEIFMTVAHKAPLRTVILAEALRNELNASPDNVSINKQEFETRLKYIDENILPMAKDYVMKNGVRSNDLRRVSDATQLIDRLSRSDSPTDQQLANKLLDKDILIAGIDHGFGALKDNFSSVLAGRILQRFELLRQMDPAAAEPREEQARALTSQMEGRIQNLLNSSQPNVVKEVLATGEALSRGMADSQVFRRTFPLESLTELATNNPDPEIATRAFKLIEGAFAAPPVAEIALDMIAKRSTASDAATEYAMKSKDTAFVCKAMDILQKQITKNDFSAFTPDAISALNMSIDGQAASIINGTNTDLPGALRTLARGRVFQDLLVRGLDLLDPATQARMQRVIKLEFAVDQLIKAKQNGTPEQKAEAAKALAQMPPGMMDKPENSSGIILL